MLGAATKLAVGAATSVATMKLDASVLSSATELAGLTLGEATRRLSASCYQQLKYLDGLALGMTLMKTDGTVRVPPTEGVKRLQEFTNLTAMAKKSASNSVRWE
eukprot:4326955-Prymnesium_polylepis.1